jgi:VWFA-related protein
MQPIASRKVRVLKLFLAICVTLFFNSIQAQNPKTAEDVVRTTTELVQTEVMVFDRRGNFVDSLQPGQFNLTLDGRKRPLQLISRVTSVGKFEAVKLAATPTPSVQTTPAASASTPLATPGRLIFFFIDDLHLSPDSLSRGRKALLRFVDQQMGPDDQVAIVSTSGHIGFLQQLTDHHSVLHAAIDRLAYSKNPQGFGGTTRITEYMASQIADAGNRRLFAYLMESVKLEFGMGLGSLRGDHKNDSGGQAARLLKNRIGQINAQGRADTSATLNVLRSLMQSSTALPGRKLIFLLSDGFIVDPRGSSAMEVLHEVTQIAAQAGAVIYSMDTRGTFTDSGADASLNGYVDMTGRHAGVSLGETSAPREPLSVLAEETGGRAIFNSNSIDEAIDQAVKETADYYVLAWRPDLESERTGKARVDVSIEGRPELRVRLRKSYFRPPQTTEAPKEKNTAPVKNSPEMQLLAALGSPYSNRSLPTSLSVGYSKNSESKLVLQASMQIPRDAVSSEGEKSELDVIGAAIDDRGLIYSFKHVLTVVPQPAGQTPETHVIWNQQLMVQPGLYQVRVAVRDRLTGRNGSAMQWIEIPPVEPNRFSMSSLFLGERAAGTPSANSGPTPIRVDVDHRFSRTSVLRFQTYVYNPSSTAGTPDVWIQAQVRRGDQQVAAIAPNRIPPEVSKDLTRLPYWTEISLEQLAPGRYTLLVSATDRAANNQASQSIRFWVE